MTIISSIQSGSNVIIRYAEIDLHTMKEFKRLADEEPEAQVMYCPGIQYSEAPGAPGEDVYWVRKIYKDVGTKRKISSWICFFI
jgi:hypothetical protein